MIHLYLSKPPFSLLVSIPFIFLSFFLYFCFLFLISFQLHRLHSFVYLFHSFSNFLFDVSTPQPFLPHSLVIQLSWIAVFLAAEVWGMADVMLAHSCCRLSQVWPRRCPLRRSLSALQAKYTDHQYAWKHLNRFDVGSIHLCESIMSQNTSWANRMNRAVSTEAANDH